jgi:hypothetical protein
LKKVVVQCPLSKHGCAWRGDYGDLQEHLLSETAHNSLKYDNNIAAESTPTDSTEDAGGSDNPWNYNVDSPGRKRGLVDRQGSGDGRESSSSHSGSGSNSGSGSGGGGGGTSSASSPVVVSSLKEQADAKYSSQRYADAEALYTKALSLLSLSDSESGASNSSNSSHSNSMRAVLLSNRAAARNMLGRFSASVEDCSAAIICDPGYEKAHVRRAAARSELGQWEGTNV